MDDRWKSSPPDYSQKQLDALDIIFEVLNEVGEGSVAAEVAMPEFEYDLRDLRVLWHWGPSRTSWKLYGPRANPHPEWFDSESERRRGFWEIFSPPYGDDFYRPVINDEWLTTYDDWELFLHRIGAYDRDWEYGASFYSPEYDRHSIEDKGVSGRASFSEWALYILDLIARRVAEVELESLIKESPQTEYFICPECNDAIVDPVPGEDYVRCDDGSCFRSERYSGVCGKCDPRGLHDSSKKMQDGSVKYLCTKCNQEDLSDED